MSSRVANDGGLSMVMRLLPGLCLGVAAAGLCVVLDLNQPGEGAAVRGVKAARESAKGRLTVRPRQVKTTGAAGLQQLKLEGKRDGLIYVPAGVSAERPAPLLLLLHGAGGTALRALPRLQSLADKHGLILLVPESREKTWDIVMGGYGPDVAFINRALEQTLAHYNIDPARIAIGGFSDGASYALSLGVTNGDLFTHIIAFSPGFIAPAAQRGSPAFFISHGTKDSVLPIETCSRKIVPRVERAGYKVRYREFDGPHTVPPDIAAEAVKWFLG